MRIDLHTHSNRSDGTDSPRDLVRHAADVGLDVIALTDHDVTVGWDEAVAAGEEFGLTVVRGIEISTNLAGSVVHLLAYDLDPTHPGLVAELDKVLEAREGRIQAMLDRLAEHGIALTVDDVHAQATSTAAVGRPHIADAMVATGQARDRDEAFAMWLASGRPGHVGKYTIDLRRALGLVTEAGGVPVIAHAWARESASAMTDEVFEELAALGLQGLEVDHLDHGTNERAQLRVIADRLGLAKTGSSDYHGTGKGPSFQLGANLTEPEEFERLFGALP